MKQLSSCSLSGLAFSDMPPNILKDANVLPQIYSGSSVSLFLSVTLYSAALKTPLTILPKKKKNHRALHHSLLILFLLSMLSFLKYLSKTKIETSSCKVEQHVCITIG